jgi:hypothetical protein
VRPPGLSDGKRLVWRPWSSAQRDKGDAAPQGGGRACNGHRLPWPWGLQAPMGLGVLPRHCQRPAAPKPRPERDWLDRQRCPPQGLGLPLTWWITHQNPADRPWRPARVLPPSAGRDARPHARPVPIPAPDRHRRPAWGRPRPPRGPRGPPLARQPRAARQPRPTGWGRRIEGGLQPHARAATAGLPHRTPPPPPGHDGDTASGDHHQGARGPPAPPPQAPGARPGGPLRMRLTPCLVLTLGGGQPRQQGPGPDPLAPRQGAQPPATAPAHPAGLDDRAMRRAARIAVNPCGLPLCATAVRNGVVPSPDQWPPRGERGHEPRPEPPRSLPPAPDGAVQDARSRLTRFHLCQPHDSPSGRDRPLAGSQEGPHQQDVAMRPHALGEQGGNRRQKTGKVLAPQTPRRPPRVIEVVERSVPGVCCPTWIKSSLARTR